MVEFEWDATKAAANLKKHRVSFQEAATVLEDPLSTTFPDEAHSTDERRFVTIGADAVSEALRGVLNTTRAVRNKGGLPNSALQPRSRAGRGAKKVTPVRAARG